MYLFTSSQLALPPTVAILRWIAAVVLFLELPVPFYWFILRPNSNYWRTPQKLGFTVALLPWPVTAILLAVFRNQIFSTTAPGYWEMLAGMAAILAEFWLIVLAKRALGPTWLVGRTEMDGHGEISESEGIYGRMRHPRYAGMIGAVVGAGLLSAGIALWVVLVIWTALVLAAVSLEGRELERRFGAPNLDYRRRAPRFMPNRFRARADWPQSQ
jgi:protein-S-isoprenylcysteine O-methyltransferase Ste14